MTGFRVALGGAQAHYEVTPDLTTLGKVIGGGLPVGAFGGRKDIMAALAPEGPVYQAGTLSGNPIAMAAGLTALNLIDTPDFHTNLTCKTQKLTQGLEQAAKAAGVAFTTQHVGGMFGMFFTDKSEVTSFQDVQACNTEQFRKFFHLMLEEGVYLAPSAFEAVFISAADDDALIDATIEAAKRCFAKL